ncbi:hypothetical protein VTN77DRAFT_6083 [Rasamsonia byssochlamydoides]|uniref:uncharacterized protein n=1 Tax=Rasamsonia byssochlamydoides TaxID=89139 RepID=UPI0037424A07
MAMPAIACIAIVGKNDNPLHISLFPPFLESRLKFSFVVNSCLDIFDIRRKQTSVDQDLGLLQAVDERLAAYGWLTNTGVKFVILVDMAGRRMATDAEKGRVTTVSGIKDSDLKPAFRALQTAYIQLLQNPFYTPDEHTPTAKMTSTGDSSAHITNQRFIAEVKRIGDLWAPGLAKI